MLVWYVLLVAAAIALWRWRRRWRALAPIVLFVAGTVLIFALAEGNVGTLYRHRAMIIPFVVVLAAPSIGSLVSRSRSLPAPAAQLAVDDRYPTSPAG